MSLSPTIARLLDGLTLRAAPFIVTVYGDVALPRGEVLWMGSLIGICGRVGINESLVRTAVSRLVQAGRLTGERRGRRSFYRLSPAAHDEFTEAAALLYGPAAEARGWVVIHAPGLNDDTVRHLRLGRMGGEVYIAPDFGQSLPAGATLLRCPPEGVSAPENLSRFWDLAGVDAGYAGMIARFAPLRAALDGPGPADPMEALIARLLLVHVFRGTVLRDPRLPPAALPEGWRGTAAKHLFDDLYARLSERIGPHIDRHFETGPAETPTETRPARRTDHMETDLKSTG